MSTTAACVLTIQAAPKIKVGFLYVQQTARNWPSILDVTGAPGSTLSPPRRAHTTISPIERQVTADVTDSSHQPNADRRRGEEHIRACAFAIRSAPSTRQMISVLEQSTGRQYRARQFFINRTSAGVYYRAAVSYITGAHSFKFGVGDISGNTSERDWDMNPVSYRFNNGVPNQITMRAYPVQFVVDVDHQFGAFAQDRWTIRRLTVNAGLRLDWFKNSFPAQSVGPAPLAPARNFTFPDTEGLNLKDLSPKVSAAYDLNGNGKTALKVSLNRNVEPYTVGGIAGANNPIVRLATTTTRTWTDDNRNFVPDCDLIVLTANGECDAVANRLFGSAGAQANLIPTSCADGESVCTTGVFGGRPATTDDRPVRGRHVLPPLVQGTSRSLTTAR